MLTELYSIQNDPDFEGKTKEIHPNIKQVVGF